MKYSTLDKHDKKQWWGNFFTNYAIYLIIILLIIYVTINKPAFLSLSTFITIIKQAAPNLILALGVGGIIVLTGTDLSAGRTVGLTACIAASLLQVSTLATKMFPNLPTFNIFAVLLLVMVIGGIVGFVNGNIVARFQLHPFIVTLGTQLIVYGLILIYLQLGNNGGQAISGLTPFYSTFIKGSLIKIGGSDIPYYVLYAALITVVMWVMWNKTTLGKNMFAVGSNPEAANVSGVNVIWTTILVFTIAGVLYGITGFIEAARIGSNSAQTGLNAELDAIAACVIGGVSFTGGVGKIRGIIIGVFLLQLITVALQWLSVSASLTYVIKGIIILFAVAIDMRKYLAKK